MRKIREILRLRLLSGCSYHGIAASLGVSSSTASEYVRRAKEANLTWPLPEDLDDEKLEALLYPGFQKVSDEERGEVDWEYIHKELKRKSVTLMLLWNEHRQQHPQGLGYSQFCKRYNDWRGRLDVWMHQSHKAGEKLFVDYAGQTISIVIDRLTGEVAEAQIFVGNLGASNFTYCEATWSQCLSDWTNSHVNTFEFIGGCPELIVNDNLKSGVHKTHLYEPELNPTYQDMARHYGVAILPARVRSPKDKAKVENAVQQVERHILAKLRNRTFFSLIELNQVIRPLLDELNNRPFQKLQGTRQSQFNELEKATLKPLPATRYEYAEWKKVRAGLNYHVELEKHFYSVHFGYVKKELHVRYTSKIVEIFYKNGRIASHIRSRIANGYTTDHAHMPKNHQKHVEWTPERIVSWAKQKGEATSQLVAAVMASRLHPQQGFRACVGIIRLGQSYGNERLEAACKRALHIGAHNYKSVESILKKKMDQIPLSPSLENEKTPESHEYIRGKDYYG